MVIINVKSLSYKFTVVSIFHYIQWPEITFYLLSGLKTQLNSIHYFQEVHKLEQVPAQAQWQVQGEPVLAQVQEPAQVLVVQEPAQVQAPWQELGEPVCLNLHLIHLSYFNAFWDESA